MTDETGKILRSYPRPIKGSLPSFLFLLVYHEQGPRKLRLDSATEWIQKPKKKEISEKFEGKKKPNPYLSMAGCSLPAVAFADYYSLAWGP